MRPLTDREKMLVRFAAAGIVIYLALFYGVRWLGQKRADYRQLMGEAQTLRQQVKPYRDRVLVVQKMMDDFQFDPAKLKRETVVSDASAAIQKAAKSGGLQLGPVRESPTHAGKSLAAIQMETSGPVPAALTFLASLSRIGFPVVVDSLQFTADNSRPGQVKINLTILVLDFEQQKSEPSKSAAWRNGRSADLKSAVSRICNPRIAAIQEAHVATNGLPNAIRRYGRLQICATKEAGHA